MSTWERILLGICIALAFALGVLIGQVVVGGMDSEPECAWVTVWADPTGPRGSIPVRLCLDSDSHVRG